MNFIENKSLGFNSNAVVAINFYGENNVSTKYNSIRNEFLSSPYILNVSRHSANVVGGLGNGWTTTQDINGNEISTSCYTMNVDADFSNTYGMKLAAGRFFSKDFPTDTTKAVIVNEAAVRTFGWKSLKMQSVKDLTRGKTPGTWWAWLRILILKRCINLWKR